MEKKKRNGKKEQRSTLSRAFWFVIDIESSAIRTRSWFVSVIIRSSCKKWKVADERRFISIGRKLWLCEYDDHYMAIITKCFKDCHRRQGWQNNKKSLISVYIHSCQFLCISCLSINNCQGCYNRYLRHSLGCKINPQKYYSSLSFSVSPNCKPRYHLH